MSLARGYAIRFIRCSSQSKVWGAESLELAVGIPIPVANPTLAICGCLAGGVPAGVIAPHIAPVIDTDLETGGLSDICLDFDEMLVSRIDQNPRLGPGMIDAERRPTEVEHECFIMNARESDFSLAFGFAKPFRNAREKPADEMIPFAWIDLSQDTLNAIRIPSDKAKRPDLDSRRHRSFIRTRDRRCSIDPADERQVSLGYAFKMHRLAFPDRAMRGASRPDRGSLAFHVERRDELRSDENERNECDDDETGTDSDSHRGSVEQKNKARNSIFWSQTPNHP